MRPLLYVIPFGLLVIVVFEFVHDLGKPAANPSSISLPGDPAPNTNLRPLEGVKGFTSADLRAGHVTVVNVWASWCVPCRAEAPALAALARLKGVPLYGVVYGDATANAQRYLRKSGNPFSLIDIDPSGRAGTAWGIAGVPETFVIDGRGVVRLHYAGPIAASALDEIILPAIAHARSTG